MQAQKVSYWNERERFWIERSNGNSHVEAIVLGLAEEQKLIREE